jgi:hypothetical protein
MSNARKITIVIVAILSGQLFNVITYRLGAGLLLISNLALPFGQHRLFMKVGGWWLFPAMFITACVGAWGYVDSHVTAWKLLTLPYVFLFVTDAWLVATSSPKDAE